MASVVRELVVKLRKRERSTGGRFRGHQSTPQALGCFTCLFSPVTPTPWGGHYYPQDVDAEMDV